MIHMLGRYCSDWPLKDYSDDEDDDDEDDQRLMGL